MIYSKYNLRALNLNLLINRYNFYSISSNYDFETHEYLNKIFVNLNYDTSFIHENKIIKLLKPTNNIIHPDFTNLKTGDILKIFYLSPHSINYKIFFNIIYFYTKFKAYTWGIYNKEIYRIFAFSNDKDYFIEPPYWRIE
ncbi:MAG: hypothetical protein ACP5RI_04045, partial [Candidatus Micrarchaeia archaeon]